MQKVKSLFQPIVAEQQGIPLVITVVGNQNMGLVEGGISSNGQKVEHYVCVSKLPPELKERVITAVQMLTRV